MIHIMLLNYGLKEFVHLINFKDKGD